MTFRYNGAGELTEKTDIHGCTTRYTYNALGQIETITDPNGNTTTHGYAPGGRHIKTTYPGGSSLTYTYDANGRIKTRQHSSGYTLTYTYDSLGRITGVTSSKNQKKTYAYDAMGNVTAATDAGGNTTRYTYTMSGKLATVTDPMGNTTEYAYDPLDNLMLIHCIGEENKKIGHKTEYIRNSFGQVKVVRDAFGKEELYVYDALGRMKEKTDKDGYTTFFTYETDGRTRGIFYADGKSVEMQYDALRKLVCVKDWLGTTKIDRNMTGQIEAVTDHMGKKVFYSYGKMGERAAIIYPDEKTVSYHYDGQLRLIKMQILDNGIQGIDKTEQNIITYYYDEVGRISEKHFPGGLRTLWHYGDTGELTELIHEDKEGVLDKYAYEYDSMGNKTIITKERRGLEKESGRYEYTYDAMSRLVAVVKDGEVLRRYDYDPFGNRSSMEDHGSGRKTTYTYDALDRLIMRREVASNRESNREYLYDNRGNLSEEVEEGKVLHRYAYNAMNRLEYAWTTEGKEVVYQYNGLGQRIGKDMGQEKENYLLDLTKMYHNLLGIVRGESVRNFYWDANVAAMSEMTATDGTKEKCLPMLHYYLLDELGSPIRVGGYGTKHQPEAGTDICYFTYGYDEFGNDLYHELEEIGVPNPYSRQGEEQPFGYTGYCFDDVSRTYFAQAREYQPEHGRFTAEDIIKGNGAAPETLNRYGYCWGNPMRWIDINGEAPEDYEYIYYVNNPGAAGGFGHTAFLIVKENGMAEYYSYSTVQGEYAGKIFDSKTDNKEYEGRLYTNVKGGIQQDISIDDFVKKGYVNEQWYANGKWNARNEGEKADEFTRGIIIPISNEQGEKIHDAAQELLYNPGVYNLWSNNCMQVAKELIRAGGEDLLLSEDLIWLETYPLNGSEMYANMAFGAGFIPNQEYLLAAMAASYYGYETITIERKKKCIND